jgi:outer membrane protein OmpU
MKIITKGKNMNNIKKIGLTALAGSLATFSVNAAEMSVNGATLLTYTSEDSTETTGNPIGMKTNIGFSASGEVNGYTVSYFSTMSDGMSSMSSNRLSIDMGDIGTISYDNASGSGLATIDDKTPSAAEEIWDGLGATGATVGGLVGYGSTGVINYVNTFEGITLNAAMRRGSATAQGDGASSGSGEGSFIDAAITGSGDAYGVEGLAYGFGYGEQEAGSGVTGGDEGDTVDMTAFVNYTYGPVSFGYQQSAEDAGGNGGTNQYSKRWGLAFNVNENLAISYGEAETEYAKPSAVHVTEEIDGIAVSYTMGSMKIAGNRNEATGVAGTAGVGGQDAMTEIAVSFAF